MTGEFLKFYRRQKFLHLCLLVANNRFHDQLVIKVFTITPHRPDHPDHRRHHCVLLVVPMFEYGNHAVAITKAFLAHTFLTATFWKVPIPKRYPSFSDFPLFLGPRAPLVQPSIGPSVRSSVPILYDDDDDDDDDEENEYDKDDKTGQVAGRQVAPYAASSSHSV